MLNFTHFIHFSTVDCSFHLHFRLYDMEYLHKYKSICSSAISQMNRKNSMQIDFFSPFILIQLIFPIYRNCIEENELKKSQVISQYSLIDLEAL